jgi:hypothetical protein
MNVNKKYLKLVDEGWETGSNSFADLGLEDPGKLQAMAHLRAAILSRIAKSLGRLRNPRQPQCHPEPVEG